MHGERIKFLTILLHIDSSHRLTLGQLILATFLPRPLWSPSPAVFFRATIMQQNKSHPIKFLG